MISKAEQSLGLSYTNQIEQQLTRQIPQLKAKKNQELRTNN